MNALPLRPRYSFTTMKEIAPYLRYAAEKTALHESVDQHRHHGYEDNADAHMKRSIMARNAVAAATHGSPDFSTREHIFFGEFDGRRTKRVFV